VRNAAWPEASVCVSLQWVEHEEASDQASFPSAQLHFGASKGLPSFAVSTSSTILVSFSLFKDLSLDRLDIQGDWIVCRL
jgi:hypothetical protein